MSLKRKDSPDSKLSENVITWFNSYGRLAARGRQSCPTNFSQIFSAPTRL